MIPFQRVSELQRLWGWTEDLLEAVRNGARSRRSLLLLVDQWEAEQREEPEPSELDIRRGDFREVLADIAPGSVTLVLTDPPYPAEYLPLWDDLGDWAADALVEGGSLVSRRPHRAPETAPPGRPAWVQAPAPARPPAWH